MSGVDLAVHKGSLDDEFSAQLDLFPLPAGRQAARIATAVVIVDGVEVFRETHPTS